MMMMVQGQTARVKFMSLLNVVNCGGEYCSTLPSSTCQMEEDVWGGKQSRFYMRCSPFIVFLKLIGKYSLNIQTCRNTICKSMLNSCMMTLLPKKDNTITPIIAIQVNTSKKVEYLLIESHSFTARQSKRSIPINPIYPKFLTICEACNYLPLLPILCDYLPLLPILCNYLP